MKLFFETARQAQVFLLTIPLGFALALGFDLSSLSGRFRPLWDVLLFLGCAFALICMTLLTKDEGLRIYHLLAVLCGMLLYFCGFGSLWRNVSHKLRQRKTTRLK
ncbi:MAG: spore cortex biosynthesis protein YabQ [Eubacteriales bacterium]|nr:spore cortex biosynthesis protein YabQ [Eubacteriales bacterium]